MARDQRDYIHFATMLIDIAMRDFEASRILFEKGFYPQTLFMFQQSLEKTIKALLLRLGLVDVKELRKELGHTIVSRGLELIASRCIEQAIVRVGIILGALEVLEKRAEEERRKALLAEAYNKVENIFTRAMRGTSFYISVYENYRKRVSSILGKLQDLMLKKLNDEEKKQLGDAIIEISIPLAIAMLPRDILEMIYMIERILTDYFINSELVEEIKKLEIDFALASQLFELMYWYAPFEYLVSKLRYPGYIESKRNLWTPLIIDKDTGIVEWYRDIATEIEKQNLFVCIKEFIEEKAKSQKCIEMLRGIREYVDKILEAK